MLERNPELEFSDKVDLDSLVKAAFNDFQKDHNNFGGIEKQVGRFYLLTCRWWITYYLFYKLLKTHVIISQM